MKIQVNVNSLSDTTTGWNQLTATLTPANGELIASGAVIDSFGNTATGVSLNIVSGDLGKGNSSGVTSWPHTITATVPDIGLSANDTTGGWIDGSSGGCWFTNTGGSPLTFEVRGLDAGEYDVASYTGARDETAIRKGQHTIDGGGSSITGNRLQSPMDAVITDRQLVGQITVDGTGIASFTADFSIGGTTAATIAAFTIEDIASSGRIIQKTPGMITSANIGL